ncbi:MAG: ZIP family metal transporter [Christensenellales bacterium]|jgi:ZIP family zinc transporter
MPTVEAIGWVLLGTGFMFLSTSLGAALVFLFRGAVNPKAQRVFLGFAAGVMIAASVWSLINPAIDMAREQGVALPWLPAAGGFALGAAFLLLLDKLLPHLHPGSDQPEGPRTGLNRTTLLVWAVTLHNIPEGMAAGLAFALAAQGGGSVTLAAALVLALGMGLQNFPEGAAISLPLKREGLSNGRSFAYGALSGVVEPIAGVITVLIAGSIEPVMPWLLSFAAGAMVYVVVEELIPEAQLGEHSHAGTLGVLAGFLLMMVLDVALG